MGPDSATQTDATGSNADTASKLAGADREVREAVAKKIAGHDDPSRFPTAAPELARLAAEGECDEALARGAIEAILGASEDAIGDPDLLYGLDIGVSLEKLVPHLEAAYPINRASPRTEVRVDNVADTAADRLRLYRIYRKLPPAKYIYNELAEYAETFDTPPSYPGLSAPEPSRTIQEYAAGIARQYVRTPDKVDDQLAIRAVTKHPSSTLEALDDDIVEGATTALYRPICDALASVSFKEQVLEGDLANHLARAYLDETDLETRTRYGVLLCRALRSGFAIDEDDFFIELARDIQRGGPLPALSAAIAQEAKSRSSSAPDGSKEMGTVVSDFLDDITTLVDGGSVPGETLAELPVNTGLREDVGHLSVPGRSWWKSPGYMPFWARLTYLRTIPAPSTFDGDDIRTVVRLATDTNDLSDKARMLLEKVTDEGERYREVLVGEYAKLLRRLPRLTDPDELEAIGKVIEMLGVYPPPQEMRDLYGSRTAAIDSEAKSINRRLRRQRSESLPEFEPADHPETLDELLDAITVKYRCDDGIWRAVDLAAVDRDLLEKVWTAIVRGEQSRFVLPYHDPKAMGIALVGMVLAQLARPSRLCLYSPGTSGRWGTIKDIEELYTRYAIDNSDSDAVTVTPLADIVPLASVSRDGAVDVPTNWTTVLDDPPSIVLVKTWDDLVAADPDAIVYNYLPSIESTEATRSGRLTDTGDPAVGIAEASADPADLIDVDSDVDALSDVIHVELHGLFEQVGGDEGRPSIGPPTPLEGAVVAQPDQDGAGHVLPPDTNRRNQLATRLLEDSRTVTIHTVESDADVRTFLDEMHDAIGALGDVDTEERGKALREILAIKSEFEGLPVPVDLHDNWIYSQLNDGVYHVPRTIDDRIRSLGQTSEDLRVGGEPVDIVQHAARSLRDRLREENPLFNQLVDLLDAALEADERVAIMTNKKTHKDMLADQFDRATEGDPLRESNIILTDPDDVRQIDDIDRLVVFGVPSPKTLPLTLHPAATRVDMLVYEGERAVDRYRDFLARRRPLLANDDQPDIPEPNIEATAAEVDVGAGERRSIEDSLYRAYNQIDTTEGDDGSSGDGFTPTRYKVQLADGTTTHLWNHHPAIVKADQELVSTGKYIQRRVPNLRPGDEIVVIDRETRLDMWEEYLREHYESSGAEADFRAFLQGIELWFDAIEEALEDATEDRPISDVVDRLEGAGISERRSTIRTWVEGVHEADGPKDLVFRSNLRIGPRNDDAVRVAAEELDSDAFENNWQAVHNRMSVFRTVNREKGKDFWEDMVARANDGSLFDYPGVVEMEIEGVEEVG